MMGHYKFGKQIIEKDKDYLKSLLVYNKELNNVILLCVKHIFNVN